MQNDLLTVKIETPASIVMREKSAQGYVIGAARIGYLPSRKHTSLGVEHIPDPEVVPLLRDAFAMAASGKSVRQVAAWLADKKITGNRGGPVSSSTVQRMLTEPFYAGFVRDRAGRLAPGGHEAVVDGKTFATVQRRLMEKRCSPIKTNGTPQPIE